MYMPTQCALYMTPLSHDLLPIHKPYSFISKADRKPLSSAITLPFASSPPSWDSMVLADMVVQVIIAVANLVAKWTKKGPRVDMKPSDVALQRLLSTEWRCTLLPVAFYLAAPRTAEMALTHEPDDERWHWISYAWFGCAWYCGSIWSVFRWLMSDSKLGNKPCLGPPQ